MKIAAIILSLVAVACAVPKYRSFEDIDVTAYKDYDTRLIEWYNCIRGAGDCSRLDANFKSRGEDIVASQCEDCRDKEKPIVRDLFSLIAEKDPYKLHIVMEVFDPESKNSKSFLHWLSSIPSTAQIPSIPEDVIEEFHNRDEDEESGKVGEKKRGQSRFIRHGGVLGGLGEVLRGLLGVVGV